MCLLKSPLVCVLAVLVLHPSVQGVQCPIVLTAQGGEPAEFFAWDVALSADGSTSIMTAVWDDDAASPHGGTAYVFVRDGAGWIQQTELRASDASPEDWFGESCALSADGNIAIIAAQFGDSDTVANTGAAYVFERNGATWTEITKLTTDDAANDDRLKCVDLSADGNVALLGFAHDDDAGSASGSAYVFVLRGSRWQQEVKLTANDAEYGDHFGVSCAVSGDGSVVLIGADDDDNEHGSFVGAAYVYVHNATTWRFAQKLLPSDAMPFGHFGKSVAMSADGTTAAIGAPTSAGAEEESGAAYIFIRNGATWIEETKLFASDGQNYDDFGWSVDLSSRGEAVIIGARRDDDFGSNSGSGYVFVRNESRWIEQVKLTPTAFGFANMGESVALSGSGALRLVGAPGTADKDGNFALGAGYIFDAATCAGDLDGDGTIGITDFLLLLADWGPCAQPCPPSCAGDLDGDCNVGIIDFLMLLANWG